MGSSVFHWDLNEDIDFADSYAGVEPTRTVNITRQFLIIPAANFNELLTRRRT